MLDFNTAPAQRNIDPIPHGTLVPLHVTVRPGGSGDGGWLKPSKDGRSQALDLEFTVTDGEFANRKFWVLMTLAGDTDGHQAAARISGSKIRAMIESARGVRPDDMSEKAAEARRVKSYGDLDGLRFIGKIGLDKSRDGYEPRNTLIAAITPDQKAWMPVAQVKAMASESASVSKPAWA